MGGDVDVDDVARLQQRDGTAGGGFGADVSDAGPRRSAGKAACGDERDGVVQFHALDGGRKLKLSYHGNVEGETFQPNPLDR